MNFELIRSFIMMVGWPVLLIGSVLFIVKSIRLYKEMHELALGKLVLSMTFGQIISMYSLAFVATVFMYTNLNLGIKIVLPVFIIWFITMAALFFVSNKWRGEAAKINVLYYKVMERTKALEQEQKKLSHVANNMPTGAILLDNIGKVMFINREAKNMLNFKSQDDGEIIGAIMEKFSRYKLREHMDECIKGNPSNILNAEVNGKVYEIFLRNLTDSDGAISIFGHFIWIRDVTDEKNLEKSKNNFITIASHKLRTPLTGIKMFIEMLINEQVGPLNIEQKNYLLQIQQSATVMVDLTNKLLKVATEGEPHIEKANNLPTDVNSIIRSAIEEAKAITGKKNEIVFAPMADNPKIIIDPDLFRKIILCLVDNSLIYSSEELPVNVEVSINGQSNECLINVIDSGIGIPEKDRSLIFKKFFRAENSMKTNTEGTGTCLFDTKTIVESIGGKIKFESEEGIGTTFSVTLPTRGKT